MTTILPTAYSSHRACMICRQRDVSLRRVNPRDIIYAYMQYGIFIQNGTRVCTDHLKPDNMLIKRDNFAQIQTIARPQTIENIVALANKCILVAKKTTMFADFRDIKYLDDLQCIKVTGWSKNELIQFSSHVLGINDTALRTKYQLIALYRYWLRTGIDQTSLASLFGENTKQWQISDFLDEIRTAIYKHFVPKYLGASKEREFYLKFNTMMASRINNQALPSDNLILVADGTYHKIEKSANNEMQYKIYSSQKSENLFKPFVICCADGYIVDCYGPFAANKNDATILNYIIETDNYLQALLFPYFFEN